MTRNPATFRFSLLALLTAVAVAAAALATLLNATPGVWGVALLVVGAIYVGAAIAALYYPCRLGRAFSGGFLIAGLAYLVPAFLLDGAQSHRSNLPTSRAVNAVYRLVARGVPNPNYVPGSNMPTTEYPHSGSFRSIGHCYWSLLFGLAGGCVARRFAARRGDGCIAQPKEDSP